MVVFPQRVARVAAAWSIGVCLIAIVAKGDEPIAGRSDESEREYVALRERLTDAYRMLEAGRVRGDDEEASRVILPAMELGPMARFMDLFDARGGDPEAAEALAWVSKFSRNFGQSVADRAREILVRDHMDSEVIGLAVSGSNIGDAAGSEIAEVLLRRSAAEGASGAIRARARLWLAHYLLERADQARYLEANRADPEVIAQCLDISERFWGPGAADRLRSTDVEACEREAVALLEQLIAEDPDVDVTGYGSDESTLAEGAAEELDTLRHLAIGDPAPEIEGEDVLGRPMRLSDYRGNVVAVVFWGTWCKFCMDQVPHERRLVARLEGRPFVLLGVNSDAEREALDARMAEEGITWRSWWDGGINGPIARAWHVQVWPASFVLDRSGIIRYKDVRGRALDEAVDALLAEDADDGED